VLRLVVIPQMARIALGPWATYATGALKRMSIASAVSVSEVMYVTKQAISATGKPFEFIFLAFALYAGISSILLGIEVLVARRMDGLHRAPSTPAIV
jgi:ABC-type amino acid transport system permease subunit